MGLYLVREILELQVEADSEEEAIKKFDRSEASGDMDIINVGGTNDG